MILPMRAMLMGLLGLLSVGIGAFVLLGALLYWGQEGVIFHPTRNDSRLLRQPASRVEIETSGATLEGWWIDNPSAASCAVIIYFGGNAEDVLYTASTAPNIDARRMLVVNYRGYGRSTGKPGQKALYEDAHAIYDYAIASGVPAGQIVVMGRSLGSAMATLLAANRSVRAAILITSFDSLAAVAAHHYPIFPVRQLLRHPFPSGEWAKRAGAAALFLSAERDYVIPPMHAQRLYESWSGEKQIHVLAGMGHNDIELHADYYPLINRFLAANLPSPPCD